ncbi:F-box domain-containing protein [Brazilian cedratvirus IHUMI]|uniref:F-box domain-containing protein n=1 Tax=Brazilian cedratvirus IHUMI TaxID=2126980 RepID=A0A2R8FEY5_9VIRU|nr:F-box domain-containing protein [Brazilian cedratvirus IHUMI]
MSLSREVLFVILQEVEVNNLYRLSSVCKEYKSLCKDKGLWKRIFSKYGLTMLKKNKSVCTWISNFTVSSASKEKINRYMERVDKVRNLKNVVMPLELRDVRHASVIHIPKVTNKDELEFLIHQDRIFSASLSPTKPYSKMFLELYKMSGEYYMRIKEKGMLDEKIVVYKKYKLSKRQVSYLLYKLAYYCLFLQNISLPREEEGRSVCGYNTVY